MLFSIFSDAVLVVVVFMGFLLLVWCWLVGWCGGLAVRRKGLELRLYDFAIKEHLRKTVATILRRFQVVCENLKGRICPVSLISVTCSFIVKPFAILYCVFFLGHGVFFGVVVFLWSPLEPVFKRLQRLSLIKEYHTKRFLQDIFICRWSFFSWRVKKYAWHYHGKRV